VVAVHLPHLKPFLGGCGYRPSSADNPYLNDVCEMIDSICVVNREVYFLGDLNIDWFPSSCLLKRKLLTVTSAYNLVQVINQATITIKKIVFDQIECYFSVN
jgi:hypothetical protein